MALLLPGAMTVAGVGDALAPQSGSGPDLRTVFNANIDDVRLVMFLSPT
jgi:hypothetical protein